MLTQINGLHHVTSLASGAQVNNDFFTKALGLRRVKKTVNFDRPDVYHLYYGDAAGSPGTVMTYFPFTGSTRGRRGTGEVTTTAFSVPKGALAYWKTRLAHLDVTGLRDDIRMGAARLVFDGPDGDGFALVEGDDPRAPWDGSDIPADVAIRGLHSVEMQLTASDAAASGDLLRFMGYEVLGTEGTLTRYHLPGDATAQIIDIMMADGPKAEQGAGSVHHIAFAVDDRAGQLEVRRALLDAGYQVTPVKDRDYFWAIYFRAPGGVLFEVATNEPGFDRDEDAGHLGEALKLPSQHAHLRDKLERTLEPIED